MFLKRSFRWVLFALLPSALLAGISYTVDFEGIEDSSALKTMRSVGELSSLKARPPASINALRYRAEADIPELLKVLHAHGYYEAKIDVQIREMVRQVKVILRVDPGPAYTLAVFHVQLYCQTPDHPVNCAAAEPENLGITLGKQVNAEKILNAEQKLLQLLGECGYPLARVEKQEMVADGKSKTLSVTVGIDTGHFSCFGPTKIDGLHHVKPKLVHKKTAWKQGELYDSRLVEKTQNSLLDTGLFSSTLVTHGEGSGDEVPMKIELKETKHRSIHVGVSYQTVFGPGITFGWENRNVCGMGRTLRLQGDFTRISHSGVGAYVHPDFIHPGQELIWQAQAMHESLFAYHERSYNLMGRIDRKIGEQIRFSTGLIGERLFVTNSIDNGRFWLLQLPIYVRWSSANDLLNPTRGVTVEFTTTPALNISEECHCYLVQQISESTYHPLTHNASIVLAQKLTVGALISPHLSAVPVPNRFLGGSEEELRGYRYRTVSPLIHHKPQGGRSAIYWTLEARLRVSKSIGLVPFFDMGNVQNTQYPTWKGTWRTSIGLGLRYFSFMGPFRVDVAFPLHRRKGIDPVYKILVSIGQTF